MSNLPAITAVRPSSPNVNAAFHTVTNLMSGLGTVWILALMLLIVADVLGRNFLDQPITGVAEIAGRSIVAIVFLQLPAAVASNRLTRSDFLIQMIGRRAPGVRRFMEITFTLIGAAIFAVLTWAAWPEFTSSWETREFFGVQGIFTIPTWPFRGLLMVGSATAVLASLLLIKIQVSDTSFGSDAS